MGKLAIKAHIIGNVWEEVKRGITSSCTEDHEKGRDVFLKVTKIMAETMLGKLPAYSNGITVTLIVEKK